MTPSVKKLNGEILQLNLETGGTSHMHWGEIYGTYVVMQASHNFKKTHSISWLAVCNARYKFVLVDIGDSGKQGDGRFCNNSHLGHAIETNVLDIPKPEKINPDSSKLCPFVFVADYAFGLKPHMMKPYPNCTTRTEDIQL